MLDSKICTGKSAGKNMNMELLFIGRYGREIIARE
jgi:hypothetical protein